MPPDATITSPVIKEDAFEHKNEITDPISCVSPNLKKKNYFI